MSQHTLHPVSITPTGGSATVIGGITAMTPYPGVQTSRPIADGTVDSYSTVITATDPTITFTSLDVGAVLGVVNWTAISGAIVAAEAKLADAGTKASGSNHILHTMATALIMLGRCSVGVRDNASITVKAVGYASSGAGLTSATSSPLTAYTQDTNKLYGLGPIIVNGSTLTSTQGFDIDFGMSEVTNPGDGNTTIIDANLATRLFSATFTTTDVNLINSFCSGSSGTKYSGIPISSTTALWLRKRAPLGYVADATAEHIKFLVNHGMIYWTEIQGSKPRAIAVRIEAEAASGSAAVTIDPAAALA